MISHLVVFIVGAIAGIAIYRNNQKRLDPIADKADGLAEKAVDKVSEKIKNR